ncbi:MAG TPA: DoxX family protein [Bacteroidales bacterium]|nr:DoxX family protein [Bacteroidales bacterium]
MISAAKNKFIPALLALLRIVTGWHFLYEGLTKIFNPAWSARPYLEGSRWILGDFFRWMASGDTGLGIINIANEWGLTLIGLALVLGLFTRLASWAGVLMLVFYYLAYPPFGGYSYGAINEGSYLVVNKNLIEMVVLLVLAFTRSGEFFGLENIVKRRKDKTDASPEPEPVVHIENATNKRRELLKGLAGLPFLAGFSTLFINELTQPQVDGVSSATLPRVTYKRVKDVKVKLPTGKLGGIEMSRMIMGCNLISGYAHARDLIYANTLFKAYNTDQKILETFHLAEMAGIDATFLTNNNYPIFHKYLKLYGGKMKSICQTYVKADDFFGDIDLAIGNGATFLYIQGGDADRWVREGKVSELGKAVEYIKKKGYTAGVGGHSLEVVKTCEREGIPADFYVKTFHHDRYWSAHPLEKRVEFSVDAKRYADHNLIHDNMFDLFPEQTAGYMLEVPKPWIAFKVLAGGAIQPKDGFRHAFENGADFICVGMFDFQVVDDVNTAGEVLLSLENRQRPWYS